MKQLLLALFIGFTAMGCCERDPDKNINPNVLPPATQVGANTGGCLVNGEVWVASTKGYSSPYEDDTTYRLRGEKGFMLYIILKNIKDNDEVIRISLADTEPLKLNHEYELKEDGDYITGHSIFSKMGKDEYYTTTNEYRGKLTITHLNRRELTITHLNRREQFISGTFEIEMINVEPVYPKKYGNKKIKITKGRFDKKYIS